MSLTTKMERLLRHHRQRVFDADGDLHHRALRRLKRTRTFRAMCADNEARASIRQGERYARMGY
jgi:hypothetical protein